MGRQNGKKNSGQGMSFGGALAVCILLIAVCIATVVLDDNLASGIGLGFNLLLAGGLAAYFLHCLISGIKWFLRRRRGIPRLKAVDEMDGEQFEEFCAGMLSALGFSRIEYTKRSADQGTDLIACRDGLRYAVQCKRYNARVGNKAVQEAFAGKSYYGCDAAVVVTNNYFTSSARNLASTTGVLLWDRDFIRAYIEG